jgi:M6 family metalloprotease-like protein
MAMLTVSRHIQGFLPARYFLCGFLLCLVIVSVATAGDFDQLAELRAQRRAAMRTANLSADKADGPFLFGLLVIPVDFSDARLPGSWDETSLTIRLTSPSGQSLRRYFSVASREHLDLRITQVPVVHLSGTRRDYSDIGLNGFSRTRALATESLEAVKNLGLEFRRLDMDGPDRTPGTDDDDGEIDGVLILHAGVGQENDAENGLVQALQFFLAEPVVSQGVSATFYAVASLGSGPGIWAHETAHLLGLEDRYDPGLRPSGGSEVRSLGGLGRFSLMASGAWGTGDGYGPALPDAYSCLQMGWYGERVLPNSQDGPDSLFSGLMSGSVDRLWTRGERGPEYFLLETRDPAAAYPFDADVPGGHLLIYHIDENLPEGQHATDGPDTWHLRVSLVEADNDFKLRRGEDPGRAEDLFPGPLAQSDFGPFTVPSSDGYQGSTGVGLTDISLIPGGVSYQTTVWSEHYLEFLSGFRGQRDVFLEVEAKSTGVPFNNLSCVAVVTEPPAWGTFRGGQQSVAFEMVDHGQGIWRPSEPVVWIPDPEVPSGARTAFTYTFQHDGGTESVTRTWYWKDNGGVLDFGSNWPGDWTIAVHPGNFSTMWHHWDGGPWLTADQTPVLACTGFGNHDSSGWPEVTYGNSGYTALTSGRLGPDIRAVRLIYAMEVEYLTAGVAMDGGVADWIGVGGRKIPAEPLSGWHGQISAQSFNVLHGQNALIQEELELEDNIPLWHTEIIPVPEGAPGPWQLQLAFGSNSLWRFRGWFVASVDPIYSDPSAAVFAALWKSGQAGGLVWTWPWGSGGPLRFIVQLREGPEAPWRDIADEFFPALPGDDGFLLPADRVYPYLGNTLRQRHEMRVLGFIDKGRVATRAIVIFPDGGDGQTVTLSLPWPNPARDSVRFLVEIAPGTQANLGIFDLRGRRILERTLAGGSQLLEWDGRDHRGGRAASGTYIIRLEGSGPAVMRKVVLVH